MYFRKMNFFKVILSPFSVLYWAITSLRNLLFKLGLLPQYKSTKTVICVGNLSMGGTGKTPHVAYIIDLLSANNTAVVSRGYGRKGTELIDGDLTIHSAIQMGDEPMELLSTFKGPRFKMIVDGNRTKALKYIETKYPETDYVFLDDGFQHRYVKRDLNILLTDYAKLFYKDFIVPLGTLRESRSGVKRADAIVVTKCNESISSKEITNIKNRISKYTNAPVYFSKIENKGFINNNAKRLDKNKSYLVITGIAKPDILHQYLSKQNINFEAETFSDHHNFSSKEIEKLIEKSKLFEGIITTEKDWMRLKETKLQSKISTEIFRINIGISFINQEETKQFRQQIIQA